MNSPEPQIKPAPVKPDVKPAPRRRNDPFNPPAPKVNPTPKGKKIL